MEYMPSNDVGEVFSETKTTLYSSGIEDDFFLDLLASRLLVERVGETGNQGWWDSRVLSETGRVRLSEVTPKTAFKSRVNLALKVGRKAESDRLPDDSISLFSFGPQLESRLAAAIEEMQGDNNPSLEMLENLSIQSLTEGWIDVVIEQTEANISDISKTGPLKNPETGQTVLIQEKGYTQGEIEPEKWRLLSELLVGYGNCTDQLQVPYFTLEPELKSENVG